MQTLERNQIQAQALAADLARVQASLQNERATLAAEAGKNQTAAQAAAARVIVLEARERSVTAAQEKNKQEHAEITAALKTKEYKDGKKQIEQLAAELDADAAAVAQAITTAAELATAALEKRSKL